MGAVVLLCVGLVHAVQAAEPGPDPNKSPAHCGRQDTPEQGIQGDVRPPEGVNCGLTFLSQVPGGGSVQGSGTCGYVRVGNVIKAYNLTNPELPKETDSEATHGGSESMRVRTTPDRAILVSGKGVWDITDCEEMEFKGEIPWPSILTTTVHAPDDAVDPVHAPGGIASTTQHELSISHDAMRVYSGLGFGVAYLDDLNRPGDWKVYNNSCQLAKQGGYLAYQHPVDPCKTAPQGEYPPSWSHSSDDNLEGTRWYGANQCGSGVPEIDECPPTARIVKITNTERDSVTVLDTLPNFAGHSMNWWRAPAGREFIVGANESAPGDTCLDYEDRPTSLGNAAEAYVAEVTGDQMRHASLVKLAINAPENCQAREASGSSAGITEHSMYNENGAALLMVEFGDAGLRVFDVRDGDNPKEVAYYNRGTNHVHSGVFHYDAARGLILQSSAGGLQVLELQPQVIRAAGLPKPTDPAYPRYRHGRPATPEGLPTTPPTTETPCPVPNANPLVDVLVNIAVCSRL